MIYKSLDRTIIELSSEYQNLPATGNARTGRSRKASTSFSTSGSDATPRKRRYVPTVDLTKVSDDDDYDDDEDEKNKSGSGSDTSVES